MQAHLDLINYSGQDKKNCQHNAREDRQKIVYRVFRAEFTTHVGDVPSRMHTAEYLFIVTVPLAVRLEGSRIVVPRLLEYFVRGWSNSCVPDRSGAACTHSLHFAG